MIDFRTLSSEYFKRQIHRVEDARSKISNRSAVVSDGRAIPEDRDMPIGVGRRINAAVMFLDICGFSSRLSETELQQSNILRTLTLFFGEMISIIEDYGGFVEKNTGDGLMAYFARDAAIDEQAGQRAVAAAMTMLCITKERLNPIIVATQLEPLSFRVTVDCGPITVAEVGAARKFRGVVAIGATANVASKMLGFAGRDEIVIGENVVDQLPQAWRDQFLVLKSDDTGWTYRQSGKPYRYFEYIGRWITPTV